MLLVGFRCSELERLPMSSAHYLQRHLRRNRQFIDSLGVRQVRCRHAVDRDDVIATLNLAGPSCRGVRDHVHHPKRLLHVVIVPAEKENKGRHNNERNTDEPHFVFCTRLSQRLTLAVLCQTQRCWTSPFGCLQTAHAMPRELPCSSPPRLRSGVSTHRTDPPSER